MKQLSIKLKVTLWYTIFMAVLALLAISLLFKMSNYQISSISQRNLTEVVLDNLEDITYDVEKNAFDFDIDFFEDGVYISVYDTDQTLLFGKVPTNFHNNVDFKSGSVQTVRDSEMGWYVYDILINVRNYGNVWVRGVTSLSSANFAVNTMTQISLIVFPFLVIFIAIGGYFITKRAFYPIKQMNETAKKISGGNDLSKRIQLGKGKDEIHQLANTFDGMLDRLQNSFESEKQFTSDVSHELRTPTSVILAQCEYALENATSLEEAKESLTVILGQSKKMAHLISQLLTLARTDKGTQSLHYEDVNLSDILEIVVDEQKDLAKAKDITILTDIEPNIIFNSDETMMMRLIINLISNAITYGKHGGNIWVGLSSKDSTIIGYVKDDGIGIPKDKISKIWDRFYQVDPSRTSNKEGGVGLGLSMVKWIVQVHGGTIAVESELNEGSTFTFKFIK